MKKILLSALTLLSLLALVACGDKTKNEEPPIKTELGAYIKENTSFEVVGNGHTLPQSYEGETITYTHEGDILTDYTIPFSYQRRDVTYDVKAEVKVGDETITEDLRFLIKASPYVYKLNITTEGKEEVVSKEVYLKGTIQVDSDDAFKTEEIEMEIRGRGNSTWANPKKPYRIKMKERTSILGLRAVKNYVLLAEYTDKSLLRNYAAHTLASYLNLGYKLDMRFVEVYFNGRYDGLYFMTEQIKEDKNGLDLDISGATDSGFLVELEADDRIGSEGPENVGWVRVYDNNFVIKDPDLTDYEDSVSSDKATYIKGYLEKTFDSFNTDEFDKYIDLDSFIDYFVLQELFKNVDVGYSSVYSYKDTNGLLFMGPVWDFDISLGNGDYFHSAYDLYRNRYNTWFDRIVNQKRFENLYIKRFKEVMDLYLPLLLEEIDFAYEGIKEAANRNFERWPIMGDYVWPNPEEMVNIKTHKGQVDYIKTYLNKRSTWLINEMQTKGYYDYIPQ